MMPASSAIMHGNRPSGQFLCYRSGGRGCCMPSNTLMLCYNVCDQYTIMLLNYYAYGSIYVS